MICQTNNNCEVWHGRINQANGSNLSVNHLVEVLREEQSKMEIDLIHIEMGERKKRTSKLEQKDNKNVVSWYNKKKLINYLNNVSFNFNINKIILRNTEAESESSSDDE